MCFKRFACCPIHLDLVANTVADSAWLRTLLSIVLVEGRERTHIEDRVVAVQLLDCDLLSRLNQEGCGSGSMGWLDGRVVGNELTVWFAKIINFTAFCDVARQPERVGEARVGKPSRAIGFGDVAEEDVGFRRGR